jgi:hypothetical protein
MRRQPLPVVLPMRPAALHDACSFASFCAYPEAFVVEARRQVDGNPDNVCDLLDIAKGHEPPPQVLPPGFRVAPTRRE